MPNNLRNFALLAKKTTKVHLMMLFLMVGSGILMQAQAQNGAICGTFTNITAAEPAYVGGGTINGVYALGNKVYAATNEGLSISTDGGYTFTDKTTENGLGFGKVSRVYVSGDTVYTATDGGLRKSLEGGNKFSN